MYYPEKRTHGVRLDDLPAQCAGCGCYDTKTNPFVCSIHGRNCYEALRTVCRVQYVQTNGLEIMGE